LHARLGLELFGHCGWKDVEEQAIRVGLSGDGKIARLGQFAQRGVALEQSASKLEVDHGLARQPP
jgi:hypothetical protein